MTVFGVGDIIIPLDKTPYTVTDGEGTVLKVIDVRSHQEEGIRVEIIESRRQPRSVGEDYWVNPKYFIYKDMSQDDAFLNSL